MLIFSIEEILRRMKAAKRFRLNLIRLMEEHEMSASDLARMMGVSPTVISRWVTGKYGAKFDSIDQICDKTGWDQEEFLKKIPGEAQTPEKNNKLTPAQLHRSAGDVNVALGFERPRRARKPKKAN